MITRAEYFELFPENIPIPGNLLNKTEVFKGIRQIHPGKVSPI